MRDRSLQMPDGATSGRRNTMRRLWRKRHIQYRKVARTVGRNDLLHGRGRPAGYSRDCRIVKHNRHVGLVESLPLGRHPDQIIDSWQLHPLHCEMWLHPTFKTTRKSAFSLAMHPRLVFESVKSSRPVECETPEQSEPASLLPAGNWPLTRSDFYCCHQRPFRSRKGYR